MVKASIVSKETHVSTTVSNIDGYVINVPSVIKLELQASQVRKIQLINGDLVVELMNGEIITIENFNDGTKNLDNSLVLLNGSALLHINLPVNGDKEVNPQIDYLALGDVDTLLHHSESDSSIMPWILAGGAVVAGGVAAASSGGSGSDGKNGVNGQDGKDGKDGKDALNAFYDYASNNGFTGSETELVELIVSEGQNGLSAYEVAKSMGYTGTVEEWIISLQGAVGADGKSAFDLAKANGFSGTETEWLASLAGKDGESVILLDMPILTSESKTELSGVALPGVKISLYNSNGKLIGSAVADENGSWSLQNTLAPNQIGQLIASNDKGSVSLPLPVINIVENLPEPVVKPILELVSNVDGEITGKATPGATISLYDSKGKLVSSVVADESGAWSMQNTLAPNQIGQLIASNDQGGMSLPLPLINIVENVPEPVVKPILELVSNVDGEITGKATPGATISLYDSKGKLVGSVVADESGVWSMQNTLAPNQIGQLIASNDQGGMSLPLPVINIVENVPEPVVKPILELVSNVDGEITGKATPGATISLYDSKGKLVGSVVADESGAWSMQNTLAPNQIGQLIASNDQNEMSIPLPLINIVENVPETIIKPTLELMGVVDGEITGNATPGVTVNLYNSKGNVVGTANVGVDGSWQIQNTLALDEIGTLIATDAKGNISLPLPIIELSKPEVTPPATVKPTTDVPVVLEADIALKGTAEAGAIIKVLQNGNVIGQTVADQGGNWSFEVNPLPQGSFGGLVASIEGKTDSSAIIINGFVLHKTLEPVILESGDKLHGTAQAGATIKVFDYGTQQFVETTADENGVWSFDVNPIINDSFGYVIAQLEHYAESDAAVAHGPVTPRLEVPTVTYNNEDKLEGLSEAFAEVTVDVNGRTFKTTADAEGVWKFDFNPLFESYGGISATLDGYIPSNLTYLYGVDTIAPNLKVELEINNLKTTFESLNSLNLGYLNFTFNDGQTILQYVDLTKDTDNAVNLLNFQYANVQKLEFWVQDGVGNKSAIADVTHAYQNVLITSTSEATGFTGMGIADSTIELTHVETGQKIKVVTDGLGNWNISNEELNSAGISVFNSNDFTGEYLTIHGEVNTVNGLLQVPAPAAIPLVQLEVIEHTLDQIVIKSEPNKYIYLESRDPTSGVPFYRSSITTNDEGIGVLELKNLNYYGKVNTQDFYIEVTNEAGEINSVSSEQLYVEVESSELILKIEGARNTTYELETNGIKTKFTTDGLGNYTFIPNPNPTGVFTIDRIDTNGVVDIPPQEFGAVVKEPAILGMVDGHLVFDVPLDNYMFKIYDENSLLIYEAPVGSKSYTNFSLDMNAMKLALEGHKYGYGEVFIDSKFVEGKKYYLEYTNTKSGGISGKLEFVLGEGGNVPQINSPDPSYEYSINKYPSGYYKLNVASDSADMIQLYVGDQMLVEQPLIHGFASIDLETYKGTAITEIKFFQNGTLIKTEAVDFDAEPPKLIIQGSDDRYIWGFSEGATHIAINIGGIAKFVTIPVREDGKFLIDTNTTPELDRLQTYQLYAIGENHIEGEIQHAHEVSTNGNRFDNYFLKFSDDYQTLYVGNALSMYPKSFKIISFETGEIVLESEGVTFDSQAELDIGGLGEGMYRVVVEKAIQDFDYIQLYINADGKAYVTKEVPTSGYNNTVFDILTYADDLGGNEVTTHDLGADPDHHFNVHELIAHDYDSSKDLGDFLATVTTTDSATGQSSTSLWVDRDGTGDQFKSTELLILQNTDINLEQLLNNGTILY